jgi:hypothetical protein
VPDAPNDHGCTLPPYNCQVRPRCSGDEAEMLDERDSRRDSWAQHADDGRASPLAVVAAGLRCSFARPRAQRLAELFAGFFGLVTHRF